MIRVAFASSDRRTVNLHFGGAESLVIYDIAPGQADLVGVGTFVKAEQIGETGRVGLTGTVHDKVLPKLGFVEGCAAVYAASIGTSSIRRLMAQGVQPIIVDDGHDGDVHLHLHGSHRDLPVLPRRRCLHELHEPQQPDRARRRLAHLQRPGGRPGGERRAGLQLLVDDHRLDAAAPALLVSVGRQHGDGARPDADDHGRPRGHLEQRQDHACR